FLRQHPGEGAEFCASLLAMAMETGTLAGVLAKESGPNISTSRNLIVAEFLKGQAPWLLMVDTDMVFEPDAAAGLLKVADPAGAPVVGGLCFSLEQGEPKPTMYHLAATDPMAFARA